METQAGGRAGSAAWEPEDLAGEGGSWAEAGEPAGKAESRWEPRQRSVLHPERSRKVGLTVGGERDGSVVPVGLRRLAGVSRTVSLSEGGVGLHPQSDFWGRLWEDGGWWRRDM